MRSWGEQQGGLRQAPSCLGISVCSVLGLGGISLREKLDPIFTLLSVYLWPVTATKGNMSPALVVSVFRRGKVPSVGFQPLHPLASMELWVWGASCSGKTTHWKFKPQVQPWKGYSVSGISFFSGTESICGCYITPMRLLC